MPVTAPRKLRCRRTMARPFFTALATLILMAGEEALLVVVRIDEPTGDVVRRARAHLARRGIVDVHAADLHLDEPVVRTADLDVGLTEDHEQVPSARLLQQLRAHREVGVHAHEQHPQLAELALLRGHRPA